MIVERGLVIREPWISHILAGRKIWEMRSKSTSIRGWIGLIRGGSGQVFGVARITESRAPLSRENYMDFQEQHRIPSAMLEDVLANNWIHPWVLADVRPLSLPLAYKHKSGAVTFVNLDASVGLALGRVASDAAPEQISTEFSEADDQPVRVPQPMPLPKTTSQSPAPIAPAQQAITEGDAKSVTFVFRPERAHARATLNSAGDLVVLAGSTAMRNGSPLVKRDRAERDKLVRSGVLVPHSDADLYVFKRDYAFTSSSKAAGIIKDGNASGPKLWIDPASGKALRDYHTQQHRTDGEQ